MYKHNSQSAQSRALGSVLNDRHNAGIDPTTFKSSSEDKLLDAKQRKTALQVELTGLNAQISGAIGNRITTGGLASSRLWSSWQTRKSLLVTEIAKADLAIQKAKRVCSREKGPDHGASQRTFEREFMIMAKRLLADPVYQRILTATIHATAQKDAGRDD